MKIQVGIKSTTNIMTSKIFKVRWCPKYLSHHHEDDYIHQHYKISVLKMCARWCSKYHAHHHEDGYTHQAYKMTLLKMFVLGPKLKDLVFENVAFHILDLGPKRVKNETHKTSKLAQKMTQHKLSQFYTKFLVAG